MNMKTGTAIVTGAEGQDGYFLIERLAREGWSVHATARRVEALTFDHLSNGAISRIHLHQIDLSEPQALFDLITRNQPEEFYNLAGQSSVSKSFSEPLYTWRTNAEAVVHLLECLRKNSPHTRFYQASSTDMFGISSAGVTLYNETSALNPQSPYASAKAAAHLLCHSYREVYGLRIASGILSNHESHRRPASFISRKLVDHVLSLSGLGTEALKRAAPLAMGNLKARRDWGFAPDYVEGMCRILRQVEVRAEQQGKGAEADEGVNYHDYVLATGQTNAVWELVDAAFRLVGLDLEWHFEKDEPSAWSADFRATGSPAVVVDASFLRVAEPTEIHVDPTRARQELGWAPRKGLEVFLSDMLSKGSTAGAYAS
ncbi:MAG TPA: GDP-mannose 4,6-dehydratase [Pyrinomonadaceae bacterium]|nr:GDP-mannose 4,6-dehydratase [Pyrinomonadaceae bacterium]